MTELLMWPFPVGEDDNIYYIRGKHLRSREFTNPDMLPYRVSWLEPVPVPAGHDRPRPETAKAGTRSVIPP